MAANFPSSPTNGQEYTVNGVIYVYDSAIGAWIIKTSVSTGNVYVNGTLNVAGDIRTSRSWTSPLTAREYGIIELNGRSTLVMPQPNSVSLNVVANSYPITSSYPVETGEITDRRTIYYEANTAIMNVLNTFGADQNVYIVRVTARHRGNTYALSTDQGTTYDDGTIYFGGISLGNAVSRILSPVPWTNGDSLDLTFYYNIPQQKWFDPGDYGIIDFQGAKIEFFAHVEDVYADDGYSARGWSGIGDYTYVVPFASYFQDQYQSQVSLNPSYSTPSSSGIGAQVRNGRIEKSLEGLANTYVQNMFVNSSIDSGMGISVLKNQLYLSTESSPAGNVDIMWKAKIWTKQWFGADSETAYADSTLLTVDME